MVVTKKRGLSRIGKRLVISIVLFSSAITLVATSIQIYLDYRRDLKQIEGYEELIRSSYLKSLTNSVWMLDDQQILLQLEGLLRLPDLEYFEILVDGRNAWSVGNAKSNYKIRMTFPLNHFHNGKNVLIGVLSVDASLDEVYLRLFDKVVIILLNNAIKTFFVSGFILFLFYRLVTRHLNGLASQILTIDVGTSDKPVSLNKGYQNIKEPDELDQIVSAVNNMQSKLKDSYRQLEHVNIQLKTEIADRQRAEEAIQKKAEEFRALADTSPLAIYMSAGLDQKAEYINPKFTKLFGYTLEEVPSAEQWWPLAYPDEMYRKQVADIWQKNVARAIKTQSQTEPMEVVVTCKDGSKKNISWGYTTIGEKGWAFGLDVTDLRRSEEKIKASLREKETLLAEIHHRVKNNLAVIISLLKLQANRIDDQQAREILLESQNRIFAMSAIHETLYGAQNLSEINLRTYLAKVATSIFQTLSINSGKIRLNNSVEDMSIRIDQASPIGLTISELISNSLKYAFPKNRTGEITLRSIKNGNEVELLFMDDGIGMPADVDWRNSNSLGLKLVSTLVEDQLDGSLEMKRENGTQFTIRFTLDSDI